MPEQTLTPFRLKPWFSPRPWGRRSLEPWYSAEEVGTSEAVGEAWLTGPQSVIETGPLAGQTLAAVASSHTAPLLGPSHEAVAATPQPAEFPLLVKLLFPADKLSVQVHPDDAQAQAMGQPRGKTECWYVLEAEPGAKIALGLQPGATADAVRAAIAAGTMEELMRWAPVAKGDMFFVDAGTVHAIGPGMVLLETQQTCDTTFRMYDYGRPRELHVEQALRVMKTSTAAGKIAPRRMRAGDSYEITRLIEQRYFIVDRYVMGEGDRVSIPAASAGCLVPLRGAGTVETGSAPPVELLAGHAIVVPAGGGEIAVCSARSTTVMHCWTP